MPPHGHGHHGGHHGGHGHHGGGGGFGPGWYGGGAIYADPYPTVIVEQAPNDQDQRTLAYIMTLPKAQRAAAYVKFFGKAPPPGMLGGAGDGLAGLVDTLTANPLITAAAAAAAYFLLFRKKGR